MSPQDFIAAAWGASRAIAVAFIYLEALDRATFSSLTPPLTTAQYHALAALAEAPQQSLGSLAKRLLCDKANASGIVDRLEILRLVTRIRAASDRRRVSLSLTPLGVEVLAEASERRAAILHDAFSPIRGELSSLTHCLIQLTHSLESAHRQGRIGSTSGESSDRTT
jgi:DNA-binding MarR family transcriptional regulator